MAAIRGNSRMPPYLLIETCWKVKGKNFEEKSSADSRNGKHELLCHSERSSVIRFLDDGT
jgi:hypothetical protein